MHTDLEWWLVQKGAVTDSELEENPRSQESFVGDAGNDKLTAASKYANERRNYEMDEDDD